MIIKSNISKEFLTLPNATVRDRRLSLDSSGFLHHVLSYSKEFEADGEGLQKIFGIGEHKLLKITRELKKCGYLQIVATRQTAGKIDGWQWNFFDTPQDAETRTRKSAVLVAETRTALIQGLDKNQIWEKRGLYNRKTILKDRKTKTNSLKNDASAGAGAGAGKLAQTAAPSPFDYIAHFCFLVPFGKAHLLKGRNLEKINAVITELRKLDADFENDLPFFINFWRNDWKSFDKKFSKYQEPRPEQIVEFWFRFQASEIETTRRLMREIEFEKLKNEIKKHKNGSEPENDYSEFADIEFE